MMFFSISTPVLSLPPAPTISLLSASLPLLIFSESNSFYLGSVTFKISSSVAFVIGPLLNGPVQWLPYRLLITSGLLLSLIGDLLLIPSRNQYFLLGPVNNNKAIPDSEESEGTSVSFKLGMLAFAAAHGAYILAFLRNAEDISWGLFAGIFTVVMLAGKFLGVISPPEASAWGNILDLSISGEMRPLVSTYAIVISCMLAASASSSPSASAYSPYQPVLGAVMFVVSDIFVAKDVFGRRPTTRSDGKAGRGRCGWQARAVGWILYFWGQMVLAGTVEK